MENTKNLFLQLFSSWFLQKETKLGFKKERKKKVPNRIRKLILNSYYIMVVLKNLLIGHKLSWNRDLGS